MNSHAHELTALRRAMLAWKGQGSRPAPDKVTDVTAADPATAKAEPGIAFALLALALR